MWSCLPEVAMSCEVHSGQRWQSLRWIGFRFFLSSAARQGTYAWPVVLTI